MSTTLRRKYKKIKNLSEDEVRVAVMWVVDSALKAVPDLRTASRPTLTSGAFFAALVIAEIRMARSMPDCEVCRCRR